MLKRIHKNCSQLHYSKPLTIMIVEDHLLAASGYKLILENAAEIGHLPPHDVVKMHSIEMAVNFVNQNLYFPDIVFLDICLQDYKETKFYSGEDFGMYLKRISFKIKIIVMTSLSDPYRIKSILQNLNPDGFLLKSEIDEGTLIKSVQDINNDIPFFSTSILKLIKNQFFSCFRVSDDEKKFLYLLSKGVPSKEIPNYLPWSLSKVEKQKRILRQKIGAEYPNVLSLVNQAKKICLI